MLTGLVVAVIFGAGGFRASRNPGRVWAAASESAKGPSEMFSSAFLRTLARRGLRGFKVCGSWSCG
jgi:hypothetical protein